MMAFARGLIDASHSVTNGNGSGPAEDGAAGAEENGNDRAGVNRKVLDGLYSDLREAMRGAKDDSRVVAGIALEYGDLLLMDERAKDASEQYLQVRQLAETLVHGSVLRHNALLRLAALLTEAGDKDNALAAWKGLSESAAKGSRESRLLALMSGDAGQDALAMWQEEPLRIFLDALRLQLQAGDEESVREAMKQVSRLCVSRPTWYSAVALLHLKRTAPPKDPTRPPEDGAGPATEEKTATETE